jgi:hypothetical protein
VEHSLLGPLGPLKGAGLKFFQVEIERFGHGSSVDSSISRQLGQSKYGKAWQWAWGQNPVMKEIGAWGAEVPFVARRMAREPVEWAA